MQFLKQQERRTDGCCARNTRVPHDAKVRNDSATVIVGKRPENYEHFRLRPGERREQTAAQKVFRECVTCPKPKPWSPPLMLYQMLALWQERHLESLRNPADRVSGSDFPDHFDKVNI